VTTITPVLDVRGHGEHVALWWAGEIVDVFPTLEGADQGRRAAQSALAQLNSTLNLTDTATELQRRFDADGGNHDL
jgi:hypothetical protein